MTPKRKTLFTALLFLALIGINAALAPVVLRIDLTSDKLYSLSPGTREILNELDQPARIDFYFTRGIEDLPIRFKNYAARIETLLKEYERASNGKLNVRVHHPAPGPDEQSEATQAGMRTIELATGENLILGMTATMGEQTQTIPLFIQGREPLLEYDITRALYLLQHTDRPVLGLLTTLPVVEKPRIPGLSEKQQPNAWFFVEELRKNFDLRILNRSVKTLPEDLDLLAIIHPRYLSEETQYAIDTFLRTGGPTLIAVDPFSRYQANLHPDRAATQLQNPTASDLPKLFEAWGIEYDPTFAIADLDSATPLNPGNPANPQRHAAWLTLDDLNPALPPTANLDHLLLIETGSFSLAPDSNLKFTPLVTTSPASDRIYASLLAVSAPQTIAAQVLSRDQTFVPAALVQGTFPTAFPYGDPARYNDAPEWLQELIKEEALKEKTDQPNQDNASANLPAWDIFPVPEPDAASETAEQVQSASEPASTPQGQEIPPENRPEEPVPSTLALIADTDFLADVFATRANPRRDALAFEPANSNIAFLSNLLEFLGGNRQLITIRGKGSAFRPFTVIRDLERAATDKYEAEIDSLEVQLSNLQNKISELRELRDETDRQQQREQLEAEIQQFQEDERETLELRRELRLAVRRDIRRLESILQALNLLTAPGIVTIAGIYILRQRRQRMRAPYTP